MRICASISNIHSCDIVYNYLKNIYKKNTFKAHNILRIEMRMTQTFLEDSTCNKFPKIMLANKNT